MRALRVELLRLRSRRAVWVLLILAAVACVVVVGFSIKNASPPSAAARASAQAAVDQQIADPAFQQQLAACQNGTDPSFGEGFDCEQLKPQVEWYLGWSPPDFVHDFGFLLLAVTLMLSLTMAVIGVTFAGAEWSTGTIGTQLLFQPRRSLVYGSKGSALILAALAVGVLGALLAWAGSYWAAAKWGTTALVEPGPGDSGPVAITAGVLVGRAARAVVLIVGAGVGGYALAMLFRSSLAAIGLIAGYGLVAETVLHGLWPGGESWLLSTRLLAFLQGPYEIVRYPESCNLGGPCDPVVTSISVTAGGVYLGVLLLAVVVASLLLFRRRDVA